MAKSMADARFKSSMGGGPEQRSAAADLPPWMARRALDTEPESPNGAGILEHDIQNHRGAETKTELAPYPRRQEQQSPLDDVWRNDRALPSHVENSIGG